MELSSVRSTFPSGIMFRTCESACQLVSQSLCLYKRCQNPRMYIHFCVRNVCLYVPSPPTSAPPLCSPSPPLLRNTTPSEMSEYLVTNCRESSLTNLSVFPFLLYGLTNSVTNTIIFRFYLTLHNIQ